MKEIINRVPIPLCGVGLSLAALGNLLQSYSEALRAACGLLSGALLALVLLKVILFPRAVGKDLGNPILASVAGTFSMALMLLSVYLKPLLGQGAYALWLVAIALHVALIVYFTIRFILRLQLRQVFASYYIVYVGIAVAAVTAPAYGKQAIGAAAFWFGLASLAALLLLVTIRYIRHPAPDPAKPLLCIYAAPASLCVAGYLSSVSGKSQALLLVLYGLACMLFLFSLIKAIGYLRLPFFPSYASFTFPFVISAIASKQTMAYLAGIGQPVPALHYLVLLQTGVACFFVAYTFVRFMMFLFGKRAAQ